MKLQLADEYQPLSEPITLTVTTIAAITTFFESPTGQKVKSLLQKWFNNVFPADETARKDAIIDETLNNLSRHYTNTTGRPANLRLSLDLDQAVFLAQVMMGELDKLSKESEPTDDAGKRLRARFIRAYTDILNNVKTRLEQLKATLPAPATPGQPGKPGSPDTPKESAQSALPLIGIALALTRIL